MKQAILQHCELSFVYVNSYGTKRSRKVWPIKLKYRGTAWYLSAYCLSAKEYRLFKLHRMIHPVLQQTHFDPKELPEQKEAQLLDEQDFPEIVLRFPQSQAYRVYDEFQNTEISMNEDQELIVRSRLPQDAWLIGYVLSFGPDVYVIEPAYLRKELARQARRIIEKNIT